jgi:hypothetical protein
MVGGYYDYSIGFSLENYLDKIMVFEEDGVMESTANFNINYVLAWLFCYRIAKAERGGVLRNLVVFDECKAVFSPFVNPTLGFDPIVFMVSMLREFGVGIVASDQMAQLNPAIFANSQLKILMGLGDDEQSLKAGRSMGLSPEQLQYSHGLGVGEAIVRDIRANKVFVLEIPKFPLE